MTALEKPTTAAPSPELARTRVYELIADVKWGCSDDLPDDEASRLPADFAEAKRLWAEAKERKGKASDRALAKACRIIEKYVRCLFVRGNVHADVSALLGCKKDVKASRVSVCGVCFTDSRGREVNLPSIRAEAAFTLESRAKLSEAAIEKWEADNDAYLDTGVLFQWWIPLADGATCDLAMFEDRGGGFRYSRVLRGEAVRKRTVQRTRCPLG